MELNKLLCNVPLQATEEASERSLTFYEPSTKSEPVNIDGKKEISHGYFGKHRLRPKLGGTGCSQTGAITSSQGQPKRPGSSSLLGYIVMTGVAVMVVILLIGVSRCLVPAAA